MKRASALILIVLTVAGCAASRTQVLQPKKAGFENYPVLEITDFKNNVGPQVPAELLQRLPNGIAEKVRALNLFQAVNRVPVATEATPETKTLVLQGAIIEYEPGSRALRYIIGFGAGKAFATVQLTAIDKATKEEIYKGNIGGELTMGVFGGSYDEVIQKLVDECTECVQTNYAAEGLDASLPKEVKGPIITQEKQVASLPRDVESPMVHELKLRNTPKELMKSDIEEMIEKYKFFEKRLSELGGFPNDLVDNGDGTITDRATGLMWEQGGSSSPLYYDKAKEYVARLNGERFLGYNDWRVPTVEELFSLLERETNAKGEHVSPLFGDTQFKCWSADRDLGHHHASYGFLAHVVDFNKGQISTAYATVETGQVHRSRCFIRAVRTIK